MHLTDGFIPLFAYVIGFLENVETQQPAYRKVREDVVRLLAQSEPPADAEQFLEKDYDQARFAVCAWVDEVLAASPWEQKHLWLKDQLQRTYFNTTAAGVEFFDRLSALGLHQREARELYYLCLALGFTGRFCNGEEHRIEQLKTSNLKLLLGSSAGVPPLDRGELFPEAYLRQDGAEPVAEKGRLAVSIGTAACLAGPPLLFAILFLIFRFTLSGIGTNFLKGVAN